ITTTGARLTWTNTTGASGYIVSYKDQRESRWTTVNAANSLSNLSGLLPGTTYEWKVRSNCSNTSATRTFVTLSSQPMPGSAGEDELAVELFPNPASSKVHLKTKETTKFGKAVSATISDMIGKTKGNVLFQTSEVEMDIADLPEGLYIVQIEDEKGTVITKRFMKR
ncbi:MAG: T9SS type A sorting domain-containing protein, partial [Flavobacteriales bacterium]